MVGPVAPEMIPVVPLVEQATDLRMGGELFDIQVRPKFVELKNEFIPVATILLPSDDDATEYKFAIGRLFETHVAPESADVKSPPFCCAEASLLPSAEELTANQLLRGTVWGVQFVPESVEV